MKMSENAVTFKELLQYKWETLRYLAICVACVFLRRDPSIWRANDNVEFTSLEFTQSKTLAGWEKRKLGCSSSNRSQKSTRISEAMKDPQKEENEYDLSDKYELSAEVLFSEIETQIEELNVRTSALAELELQEDLKLYCKTAATLKSLEDNKFSTAASKIPPVMPTIVAPVHSDEIDENVRMSNDSVDAEVSIEEQKTRNSQSVNARKPPIRRVSKDRCNKPLKKIQPRQRKSSILSKSRISPNFSETDDGGVSAESRDSTPSLNSRCGTPHASLNGRQTMSPLAKKIIARKATIASNWPSTSNSYGVSDLKMREVRRNGWISDNDILDRSLDASSSSSSISTCGTQVPPLTQHNLARHNHHLLSRQTSTTTRRTTSSGKTVRLSDMPSTSYAPYESPPPEETPSFVRRIWLRLSSFKSFIQNQENVQQVETKVARPLRRSRTVGINIKDIPNFGNHHDSDAESDKTGKKSSASTTKIRSIFAISKSETCNAVHEMPRSPDQFGRYSRSLQSEMTSTPSGVKDCRVLEDVETFSIPGTVPSSSRTSPLRHESRNQTPLMSPSSPSGRTQHTPTNRHIKSSRANSNLSGYSLPAQIKEETESNDKDILRELKERRLR